jgi:hypothetical protein
MLAFAMMAIIRRQANAMPLKKGCAASRQPSVPDPLVNPGGPSYRHQARTAAHPARAHHRMVTLAPRPLSRSAPRPPQKKKATVMLVFNQGAPWT